MSLALAKTYYIALFPLSHFQRLIICNNYGNYFSNRLVAYGTKSSTCFVWSIRFAQPKNNVFYLPQSRVIIGLIYFLIPLTISVFLAAGVTF